MSEQKYIRVEEAKKIIKHYRDIAKDDTEVLVAQELYIAIKRMPTYTPADILAGCWEPVTEEQPSPLTKVLVLYNDGSIGLMCRWAKDDWTKGVITHWMLLPGAPKENT